MVASPAFRPVAVIPVYNHGDAVGAVVAGVRAHGLACILVDDGSEPRCAAVLDALAQGPGITLVRLARNQGKGGAMIAGLRAAAARRPAIIAPPVPRFSGRRSSVTSGARASASSTAAQDASLPSSTSRQRRPPSRTRATTPPIASPWL